MYMYIPDTDESYELFITTIGSEEDIESHAVTSNVTIRAENVFGVRHALESLSSMVVYDTSRDTLEMLDKVYIKDRPARPFRGITIDAERRFAFGRMIRYCS